MMTATKTYPWGSIEVKFEVTANEADGRTLLAIMNAHTSIQETLDTLAMQTASDPPPPERCPVARENTAGTYYCSREVGHDGPCAAWPGHVAVGPLKPLASNFRMPGKP